MNIDRAIVAEHKLTAYLLSDTHPFGASKAKFFKRFGFTTEDWPQLRDSLLDHIKSQDVSRSYETPFGQMLEIIGPLSTPDRRNPKVLTVWMVAHGEDAPRLVTVVPA